MNSKTTILLLSIVSGIIFLVISVTNNSGLLGTILGFWTGVLNIQWLFRDANKVLDKDLKAALKLYYNSLFARLGMVTLVIVTVGLYQPEWLFYLTVGIGAGVIIPLILAILRQYIYGRG